MLLQRFLRRIRHSRTLSQRLTDRMDTDTDAAFLDSSNLPGFNRDQLEGRLVRALTVKEVWAIGLVFVVFLCAALVRGFQLQYTDHAHYATLAEENRFEKTPIIARRGVIEDRFGRTLAWNAPNILPDGTEEEFPMRLYDTSPALAHMLGYVREPKRDKKQKWWRTTYEAHGGIEGYFDMLLAGKNGEALREVDSQGKPVSFIATEPAIDGAPVRLSIDAQLTKALYTAIENGTHAGFIGGGGVIMDVRTGEIVAMTSYPSFNINAFAHPTPASKESTGSAALIEGYLKDTRYPLLDRTYQGAYLPGSIVKPFVALAALEEGVITPEKGIVSTGKLVIPNPYDPSKPSIFRDWKAHGWVDMREAIAVSSDVYFYEVGGGFGDQKGMGIAALHRWMTSFGFGEKTGIVFEGEQAGNVPSPEWKQKAFATDTQWNIGNTYHSSIGQYGWLMTPLQAVRAFAALANGGTLFVPRVTASSAMNDGGVHETATNTHVVFAPDHARVVYEGMEGSTNHGTAKAINMAGISIAGKTGTAEVGAHKEYMNSWVVGFWPAEKPAFAFAVMLEKAPAGTLRGAAPAMRPFFETLVAANSPYIHGEYPKAEDVVKKEDKKDNLLPPRDTASQEIIPEPAIPAFIPGN